MNDNYRIKEEEIIQKVISIPIENWTDFSTTYNGVSIKLIYTGNGMNPCIDIEGEIIYSKSLWQILNPLNEAKELIAKEKKENTLTGILNKLK